MLGNLLVITPRFVGCLIAVAAVAWIGVALLWVRRRGRWPRVHIALAGLVALCLTATAAGDAVNAHYQFLPRVDDVIDLPTWPQASMGRVAAAVAGRDAGRFPAGAVVSMPLPGPVSGFGTHAALVYLPPQYFAEPTRRFPVVYLLHGSPGAPVDWFRAARAAQDGAALARAGSPTILVAPRVSRRWTDDSECVDRPSERIETYVVDDVVPDVDHRLRTVATRGGRAVAGMSAGGYCALNIGLKNRDVFGTVIDMSGYDVPTHTGGMAALYGTGDTAAGRQRAAALARADAPYAYIPTLPVAPVERLWLDGGRTDATPDRQLAWTRTELAARGQQVRLTFRPGGHTYGVWRPALAAALAWAAPGLAVANA